MVDRFGSTCATFANVLTFANRNIFVIFVMVVKIFGGGRGAIS